jgi:hypothetical protein
MLAVSGARGSSRTVLVVRVVLALAGVDRMVHDSASVLEYTHGGY